MLTDDRGVSRNTMQDKFVRTRGRSTDSSLHRQRPKRADRRGRRANSTRTEYELVENYAPAYTRSSNVVGDGGEGDERGGWLQRKRLREGEGERSEDRNAQCLEAIVR